MVDKEKIDPAHPGKRPADQEQLGNESNDDGAEEGEEEMEHDSNQYDDSQEGSGEEE